MHLFELRKFASVINIADLRRQVHCRKLLRCLCNCGNAGLGSNLADKMAFPSTEAIGGR
jgi:hypothetical protein